MWILFSLAPLMHNFLHQYNFESKQNAYICKNEIQILHCQGQRISVTGEIIATIFESTNSCCLPIYMEFLLKLTNFGILHAVASHRSRYATARKQIENEIFFFATKHIKACKIDISWRGKLGNTCTDRWMQSWKQNIPFF